MRVRYMAVAAGLLALSTAANAARAKPRLRPKVVRPLGRTDRSERQYRVVGIIASPGNH